VNATLSATHTFTASTEDRARCTCGKSRNTKAHGYTPTRGAGRAAAEKLADAAARQEQAADTAQAAEDAVEAVYARFAAKKAQAEESPADARQARASELAEAVASGAVTFDAAATELLGGAPVEVPAEEPTTDPAEAARQQVLSHPVFAKLSEEARAQIAANAAEIAAYAAEVAAKPTKAPKAAKAPRTPKEPAPEATSQIGTGVVRFTLTTEEGTVAYTSGSQINRDYAKAVEEGRPAVLRTIKGHIIRQNPSA